MHLDRNGKASFKSLHAHTDKALRPSTREFVMILFISENELRHQKKGWS